MPDLGFTPSVAEAHRQGFVTVDEAEKLCRARLLVHGHRREGCGGFPPSGTRVQGLAARARHQKHSTGDLLHRFVHIEQQQLRRGSMVSMAVARGAAYGAGADLFAACIWRVAAPTSRFRFPGFRFGVALGTRHLARVVAAQHARSILLTGQVVDAQEAAAIGLAMHVVEPTADLAATPVHETAALDQDAVEGILRLTGEDTEDADLASLVHSLANPGLHRRIALFREGAAVRSGTGKSQRDRYSQATAGGRRGC